MMSKTKTFNLIFIKDTNDFFALHEIFHKFQSKMKYSSFEFCIFKRSKYIQENCIIKIIDQDIIYAKINKGKIEFTTNVCANYIKKTLNNTYFIFEEKELSK